MTVGKRSRGTRLAASEHALQCAPNIPAVWSSSLPNPHAGDSKYARGSVFISGGYPMTGAARMAARGAMRIGAGLTTVVVSKQAFPIYAASLTSAIVVPLKRPSDFQHALLEHRYSALLIGPGAESNAETRARVLAMLATGVPTVLDADALTAFEQWPEELFHAIQAPCVITPHEGEYARLFTHKGNRLQRARAAARESGAVMILKGHDTVIAAPNGRAVVNRNAPPSLATAGSGDVLSGFVLGLLGQGMDAFHAAAAATWMHGEAARLFGPGLIAEDLPEILPAVLRGLQQSANLQLAS